MSGKPKFGITSALIIAIAAAPALACLIYLAQHADTHKCCPHEKTQSAVLVRCCVYTPAVTSRCVNVPAPMIVAAMMMASDSAISTSDVQPLLIPGLNTSPPGFSTILRI